MFGSMQDWPLTCNKVLDHAARFHKNREIISRSVEGPITRQTYAQTRDRALALAKRLDRYGLRKGDRAATLAWNTVRHMEVWYGLTGIGAVYHTVNPRLFPEQISWIINHAEDRLLFVDLTFVPIVEQIIDQLPLIELVIILTDTGHMPKTSLANCVAYEDWLAESDSDFNWVDVDENDAAGMCYTSGTTGNPKGVVYSHRSNVLHAFQSSLPDMMNLSAKDRVLPVVPLFHANGWALAFSAPLNGATLVLPGALMDGESIYELLSTEKCTFSGAVPTVWLMLIQYMQRNDLYLPDLERVVIGGSACPRSMTKAFRDDYGVEVMHAWGMTELSPIGTICSMKPEYADLEGEAWLDIKETAGHPPFGVEMKIVDDENKELPWNGAAFGRLLVRGPCVTRSYYKLEGEQFVDEEGWFDTGDVATIDEWGYMQITDRSKDVIKSGGEWISSIDLENLAIGHPAVAEAAVIGVKHSKWDERPLLILMLSDEEEATRDEILAYMDGKIAKWWMPDDVVFVDEIPHTATGKIKKVALREQFKDYKLPSDPT
ncbi:MAG: long-chain-fatty-acid--CoA ligase [Cohaesibacter sp.]|nr:long-chain-fatty-acid--CoA ligase [Cohaesibacter sp.]